MKLAKNIKIAIVAVVLLVAIATSVFAYYSTLAIQQPDVTPTTLVTTPTTPTYTYTTTTETITEATTYRWPEKLLGGGATFVNPLMQKWSYEFGKKGLFAVDYQSIGSGQGIAKLKEQAIDFAASDAPLKKADWESLKNVRGGVVHIPITIGSVVLIFNVPEIDDLRLTQELILKILDGTIKKWNDERLVALNPSLKDVDRSITVVYRADRSGTTFILTDFLEMVSNGTFPRDLSFKLPESEADKARFIGARGNEGVTETVKQVAYSIGYVELSYAILNNLKHAAVQNYAGNFVKASMESVMEAVDSVMKGVKIPDPRDDWSGFSLLRQRPSSKNAYPIISFSYVLFYIENPPERAMALREFLTWVLTEGQRFVKEVPGYVPLPKSVTDLGLVGVSYIR